MKWIDLQNDYWRPGCPKILTIASRLGLSFRFLIGTPRRDDRRHDRRTAPPSSIVSLLRAYQKPPRPSVSLRREAQTLPCAFPTFCLRLPPPLPPRFLPHPTRLPPHRNDSHACRHKCRSARFPSLCYTLVHYVVYTAYRSLHCLIFVN